MLSVKLTAQPWLISMNYNIAFPGNEMSSYITNPSLLGFSLDVRHFIKPSISIGGSFGQQLFYWQTTAWGSMGLGLINSQIRFMNTFPLMLNTHFYLKGPVGWKPYCGVNVGGYYEWNRSEVGIVVFEGRKWRWGLAPEAGVIFPLGRMNLNVGSRFNYLSASNSDIMAGVKNRFYMSMNIGIVFFK